MDFLDRLAGRAAWPPASSMFKLTNLHPTIQKHLQKVYMTLALATAVSAVGCFLDIQYHIGGMATFLCALGSLMYLSITSPTAANLNARYGALAAFSFSQGASLGPLVDLAIEVNPAILLTAFMATTAVFGSFSLAALMTTRRTYLYLGGYLSAAISCLLLLRLSSWLFPAMRGMAFEAHLYLGLLIFSGYVLFDTQMIVERAGAGLKDHVRDALDLFVDLMALFVRILVIVLRNQARKEDEDSRRRNSNKRR